jgi:2-polyprenyl-6-methoxyphenol hydroxylase-like FAD-dependent oxidoreductase
LAAETTGETLQAVGGLHIMPPVPHWHRGRMVLVGDAVHAPSNSTGQGASLAMESAIQLARCLRDVPDPSSAFTAYERLRRPRVEKIAARGARISHAKAPGPVAQRMMRLLLPVMMATMNLDKTMAAEQRYAIDWDRPVQEDTKALA